MHKHVINHSNVEIDDTPKHPEKHKWGNGLKQGLMSLQNKLNFNKKTRVHVEEVNKEEEKVQVRKEESFEVIASPQRHKTVAVSNAKIMEDQST